MPPVRRMTFDVDLHTAREVARSFDATLEPASIERLHGGSTEVYQIGFADRRAPLVLKLYADEPVWSPGKEALVARWLDGAIGLPTPRWLKLDETRAILPLRFALMSWLPGETLRRWMGDPGMEDVYRQMGQLMRQVHTIPMAAYGYVRAEGIDAPRVDNAEYMAQSFDKVIRQFRDLGGDVSLARQIETMVAADLHLAAETTGPVLCHNDFHQGNVLAVRDGAGDLQLSGLIDFGNTLAGDALFDLAKGLFCSRHEDARSYEPLLAGYGPILHSDPDKILRLYTLFHRASMWGFLTRIGRSPTAEDGPAGLLHDLDQMTR